MFKQYRKIESGEFFVVALDTSSGGMDYTAAQFLSKTKVDVPMVYHSRETTSASLKPVSDTLERIYDATGVKPVVAVERQNGGSFLVDQLMVMNRANKYDIFRMPRAGNVEHQDPVHYGWDTTTATRPKMLQDLKEAIDSRVIGLYDESTINELFSFVIVQTSSSWKAQAEVGAHDDLVMALAIAWQMYQTCTPPIGAMEAKRIMEQFPKEPWRQRSWY